MSKGQTERKSPIDMVEKPPSSIGGILLRLGPGLVIAGSIVGSGELIATTATGATAGIWLLWLIILGCVIKVFVQVEFGRYAITTGTTTLRALNQVPGPRIPNRGNWLVWYWVVMFSASLAQLGGIVGGVGQALSISVPITQSGKLYNEQMQLEAEYRVNIAELKRLQKLSAQPSNIATDTDARLNSVTSSIQDLSPQIVAIRQETALQQRDLLSKRDATDDELADWDALQSQVTKRMQQLDQRPELLLASIYAPNTPDKETPTVLYHGVFAGDSAEYGLRRGHDDRIWAAVIAVLTSIILVMGRYGVIQNFSTFMVASFTAITVFNLFALQGQPQWAISGGELFRGLSFRLPPGNSNEAISVALATFGIIGVGASELVAYPYWCLEKGYGRFTGTRDSSSAWATRAKGWLRVMRWDCWCSMVVYTFATIAFYLLGAGVLHRIGLAPAGTEMIRTLSVMYEPVFGTFAQSLFLFGAFAVLYSTFFVANAGQARMCADAMRVTGVVKEDESTNRAWITRLSGLFPFICLFVYIIYPKPKNLVLLSGLVQALMLPMLAGAGLYFRYQRSDKRITPGKTWDVFLWLSAAGMLVTGVWAFSDKLLKIVELLSALVGSE